MELTEDVVAVTLDKVVTADVRRVQEDGTLTVAEVAAVADMVAGTLMEEVAAVELVVALMDVETGTVDVDGMMVVAQVDVPFKHKWLEDEEDLRIRCLFRRRCEVKRNKTSMAHHTVGAIGVPVGSPVIRHARTILLLLQSEERRRNSAYF
jgi:hypothetical protein